MNKTYVPRNDFVVVQLLNVEKSDKGILYPQISKESKEIVIVAIGPNNTNDLKVGDSVLISYDADVFPVPGEKDLFLARQDLVAGIVKPLGYKQEEEVACCSPVCCKG
jgi:co-chaperonin GroES (HSP10)